MSLDARHVKRISRENLGRVFDLKMLRHFAFNE